MVIPRPRALARRWRRLPRAAPLGVAAMAAGVALGGRALRDDAGGAGGRAAAPPTRALPAPAPVQKPSTITASDHEQPRRPARPVRVLIPAIGVRAEIIRLGLNRDRTLQ